MKQFRLTVEGTILFQQDPTNPLPGKSVGRITKGDGLLQPHALIDSADIDPAAATTWLQSYINETLQPLILLNDTEQIPQCARDIAKKLHDALGILPRSDLEDLIAGLDEEGRAALRSRKIRLGPILVFLPSLNKPAAVKLRALLWTLWHNGTLPAFAPPDGVTSITIAEQKSCDPLYFRAIGYPVYGPRAIRVDMLDRLISAIYDSANKGVFRAKHEMAEWLGCPIPDLYAILEAMDHKKLEDPAEEKAEVSNAISEKQEIPLSPAQTEEGKTQEADASANTEDPATTATATTEAQPSAQAKPLLALFRLRRGKAYGKLTQKEDNEKNKKSFRKPATEKYRHKAPADNKRERPSKEKRPRPEPREKIISAGPERRIEDSPFAILKNLKAGNKE